MKTALIVSEYNPFHNGHSHQINYIKNNYNIDNVISMLSGNFVQRGQASILDKFYRTKLALLGGCNLVLELPSIFAVSSAEFFSYGAISIAEKLKNVDYISFGVENLNRDLLLKIATILNNEDDEFKNLINIYLKEGNNYPKSRNLAMNKITNGESSSIMDSPNNILAIEYIRTLLKLNSNIDILPIKRDGLGYHEIITDLDFKKIVNNPSATAVRDHLSKSDDYSHFELLANMMPKNVYTEFKEIKGNLLKDDHMDTFIQLLYYKLLINGESIFKLPEASDGLGERIIKNTKLLKEMSYEDFVREINTRRFTNSRIKRLLLHFVLGFENLNYKEDRKISPNEVRILGSDEIGREYLKSIKKITNIELKQNLASMNSIHTAYDIKANNLYSILNPNYNLNKDYITSPIILK